MTLCKCIALLHTQRALHHNSFFILADAAPIHHSQTTTLELEILELLHLGQELFPKLEWTFNLSPTEIHGVKGVSTQEQFAGRLSLCS